MCDEARTSRVYVSAWSPGEGLSGVSTQFLWRANQMELWTAIVRTKGGAMVIDTRCWCTEVLREERYSFSKAVKVVCFFCVQDMFGCSRLRKRAIKFA
jgi:hypothetical protein